MTSRDFAFWLQGYLEINGVANPTPRELSAVQVACIQRHLALVFKHEIDPSAGPPVHQASLDAIHGPKGQHGPIGGPGPGGTLLRC